MGYWNGPQPQPATPTGPQPTLSGADAVKAASDTPPAFEATGEPLNDEIPF
jgi:hypothetical protein